MSIVLTFLVTELSGNGRWRFPWSDGGNSGVATVTPRGSHRPSRCRDDDCYGYGS